MTAFDKVSLLSITAVAALLRLPGIETRGQFDADQGHDMLTLVAFTREGVVPLLGPKTSVGDFHHGAFYYFLLAPAAALSNGDPVAVTAFIALLGIGAVALTWWLARAIGGSVAGAIAGILLASSPAAIEESTFIWNPNPIGFFAALSLASAWKARTGGRPIWWAIAIGAAGAVVQLHVLGVVFFLAILGFALLDLRRGWTVGLGVVAGLAIVVVLFLPLVVHELSTNFEETRLIRDYLFPPPLLPGVNAPPEATTSPLLTIPIALLRIVGWPLMGLVTDVPVVALVLLGTFLVLVAWAVTSFRGPGASAYRWLVALLAWSTVVLALVAPALQTVVSGLPNDHYHAFLDPVLVILVAVPAAELWRRAREAWTATRRPAAGVAVAGVWIGILALLAVGVWRRPPSLDPNGGWPAALLAGQRIVAEANGAPVALYGTPDIKLPDGIGYPIAYSGGRLVAKPDLASGTAVIVIACDRLFDPAQLGSCGGPAEEAALGRLLADHPDVPKPSLVTRFDASPRIAISIYRP